MTDQTKSEIAWIIDPTAWNPMTGHTPHQRQLDSLAKADAILALLAPAATGCGAVSDLPDSWRRMAQAWEADGGLFNEGNANALRQAAMELAFVLAETKEPAEAAPQPDHSALIAPLRRVRDFVADESDNRHEAGAYMSDYRNEAEAALEELNGVLAALERKETGR